MPFYIFTYKNKTKEIFFHMNEKKEYVDEKGNKWVRVYVNGQINTNSTAKINPFSEKDWVEKTSKIKGTTIGEMTDLSAELSQKREQITGNLDPVKNKAICDYEIKTHKIHPSKKKKSLKVDLIKGTVT